MNREQRIERIMWYLAQLSDEAIARVFWMVDRMFLRGGLHVAHGDDKISV